MDKMLNTIKHFFEVNVKIKQISLNIYPPSSNDLDRQDLIVYINKVRESLNYMFSELESIALNIYGEDSAVLYYIDILERKAKNQLNICGLNIDGLRKFYEEYISNIDSRFKNAVKDECVAYDPNRMFNVIRMANTVNEILHFLHMDIMNNDLILQAIPPIKEKANAIEKPICLRGESVPIFEKIYDAFPTDISVGETDIVVINETRAIMMVRDRGHALTISMNIEGDSVRIDYYIPKIINVEMINRLPGVRKVPSDIEVNGRTSGITRSSLADLPNYIIDFIKKVPTDDDRVEEIDENIRRL